MRTPPLTHDDADGGRMHAGTLRLRAHVQNTAQKEGLQHQGWSTGHAPPRTTTSSCPRARGVTYTGR